MSDNLNLKEQELEQEVVEELEGLDTAKEPQKPVAKKQGAFHWVFKILIAVFYLLSTGYLVMLLAETSSVGGLALIGYLAMLIYLAPVYVVNLIMSIVGLVVANKGCKNGKYEKKVGYFYIISIIVNILTYFLLWVGILIIGAIS
jgi:hypothetical protein